MEVACPVPGRTVRLAGDAADPMRELRLKVDATAREPCAA